MNTMDDYLATLGLWRKPTAQDKTCLYRAVSEQLFHTQAYYQRLKKVCDRYIEHNQTSLDEECKGHGQLDISALSKLFRRTFIIYKEPWKLPVIVNEGCPEKIVLCFSGGHHYDSVYPRSYIESAAICQSIVYEVLYKDVFGMESPVETSNEMINPRPNRIKADVTVSTSPINSVSRNVTLKASEKSEDTEERDYDKLNGKPAHWTVPFPYKVAKAMAADIYRNVELDVWVEANKEQGIKGIQTDDSDLGFIPGDKCKVTLDGKTFIAHIQEIEPEHGPTTVFIEELGKKHTVPLSSLRPLPPTDKSAGWSHNEDVQSVHQKRRCKKTFREHYNMSSTEQDKGSTSPHVFRASSKTKFQHIINAAGHPIKNNYPQRIRSYSDSGTVSSSDLPVLGDGSQAADTQSCGSGNSVDSKQRVTYTPPPPRPKSYGTTSGSPLANVANQSPAPSAQIHLMSGSPMAQPHLQAQLQPAPQPQMIPVGAMPAGPHPASAHAFNTRSAVSNCTMNGAVGGMAPNPLQESQPITGHLPCLPYIAVPYSDTITGPVNYRVLPSSDPRGIDLPMHDLSTIRFFFNLGIAYYQIFTYISSQSAAPTTQQMAAPPVYPAGGEIQYTAAPAQQMPPTIVMRPPVEADFSGQCQTDKALVKDQQTTTNSDNHSHYLINVSTIPCAAEKQNVPSCSPNDSRHELLHPNDRTKEAGFQETSDDQDKTKPDPTCSEGGKHDEARDLCDCPSKQCDKHEHQDSGCVSDASSGNGETSSHSNETGLDQTKNPTILDGKDNCDAEVGRSETFSQHSQDVYNDDEILELLRQPVFTRPFRNKQNRKPVPPKLVRPIKDIPPRFKKLLEAEAIAQAAALRKNQYEGAPLIRQIMMGKNRRHRHLESPGSGGRYSQLSFNPNAQCFIPGQPYQCSFDQSSSGVGYGSYNSVPEACGSGHAYVDNASGAGSIDGSVAVSSAPTYTFHIVDGSPSSVSSVNEGYYCECPSNSLCVSSSGTYYI